MKVLVCGSRAIDLSIEDLDKEIRSLDVDPKEVVIISGGAKGPDTTAINWANQNGNEFLLFKPDWDKYGNVAGLIRNKSMVNKCDVCIAFWDGESKGTAYTIDYAKKLQKNLIVVKPNTFRL